MGWNLFIKRKQNSSELFVVISRRLILHLFEIQIYSRTVNTPIWIHRSHILTNLLVTSMKVKIDGA